MLLSIASASQHLGTFTAALLIGFAVGVYGQMSSNKALVLTGILIIAVVTLLFVALGEVQTF